jgi:hypothetical protein
MNYHFVLPSRSQPWKKYWKFTFLILYTSIQKLQCCSDTIQTDITRKLFNTNCVQTVRSNSPISKKIVFYLRIQFRLFLQWVFIKFEIICFILIAFRDRIWFETFATPSPRPIQYWCHIKTFINFSSSHILRKLAQTILWLGAVREKCHRKQITATTSMLF